MWCATIRINIKNFARVFCNLEREEMEGGESVLLYTLPDTLYAPRLSYLYHLSMQ